MIKAYIGLIEEEGVASNYLVITDVRGLLIETKRKVNRESLEGINRELDCFQWGVKTLKSLLQNETVKAKEVVIIINNKQLYSWLGYRVCKKDCMGVLSDTLLELSFMPCRTEIINMKTLDKMLVYAKNKMDKEDKEAKDNRANIFAMIGGL